MVGPWSLHESDLANYLSPHVESRRRSGPLLEGDIRPIDALGTIIGVRHQLDSSPSSCALALPDV